MADTSPTPSRALHGEAVLADALVSALLEARLVAVLATHEPDGAIHAVAVWYARDGDRIALATGSRSRKVENLVRDDRATLTLHDSRPGYEVCGACLVGRAAVVGGHGAVPLVELVHGRYVEPAAAESAGGPGLPRFRRRRARVPAERAFTWDERGSDAARQLAESGLAIGLESTSPGGCGHPAANDLQ